MDRLRRLIKEYYHSLVRRKNMNVDPSPQGSRVGDEAEQKREQEHEKDQPSDPTHKEMENVVGTDDETGREDIDLIAGDETDEKCCRYYTGLLAMNDWSDGDVKCYSEAWMALGAVIGDDGDSDGDGWSMEVLVD